VNRRKLEESKKKESLREKKQLKQKKVARKVPQGEKKRKHAGKAKKEKF